MTQEQEEAIMDDIAKQKLLQTQFIPPTPPEADRVKELWYTSHLEGSYDIPDRDKEGNVVGVLRTSGDIPEQVKRDYTFSLNKIYSLGTVDDREMRIDSLEHELLMLLHNARIPKKLRNIDDAYTQQGVRMLHSQQVNMSKAGFNRQMSSTITQVQGQFYKVGSGMKNMLKSGWNTLKGGDDGY